MVWERKREDRDELDDVEEECGGPIRDSIGGCEEQSN